jgi:hypothetical protein
MGSIPSVSRQPRFAVADRIAAEGAGRERIGAHTATIPPRFLRGKGVRPAAKGEPAPGDLGQASSPMPWQDTFGFQSMKMPVGLLCHSQTWICQKAGTPYRFGASTSCS